MIEQHHEGRSRPVRSVNPVAGLPAGQMVVGGVAWLGMAARVSASNPGQHQPVVFGSAHGDRLLELLRAC